MGAFWVLRFAAVLVAVVWLLGSIQLGRVVYCVCWSMSDCDVGFFIARAFIAGAFLTKPVLVVLARAILTGPRQLVSSSAGPILAGRSQPLLAEVMRVKILQGSWPSLRRFKLLRGGCISFRHRIQRNCRRKCLRRGWAIQRGG